MSLNSIVSSGDGGSLIHPSSASARSTTIRRALRAVARRGRAPPRTPGRGARRTPRTARPSRAVPTRPMTTQSAGHAAAYSRMLAAGRPWRTSVSIGTPGRPESAATWRSTARAPASRRARTSAASLWFPSVTSTIPSDSTWTARTSPDQSAATSMAVRPAARPAGESSRATRLPVGPGQLVAPGLAGRAPAGAGGDSRRRRAPGRRSAGRAGTRGRRKLNRRRGARQRLRCRPVRGVDGDRLRRGRIGSRSAPGPSDARRRRRKAHRATNTPRRSMPSSPGSHGSRRGRTDAADSGSAPSRTVHTDSRVRGAKPGLGGGRIPARGARESLSSHWRGRGGSGTTGA